MDAKRVSAYARIKGMIRSCLILTFLLGITWIFGFLQMWGGKTATRIFSFIFVILNCSTGIFIFIYTVILDAKMMEASKKTIQRTSRRLTSSTKLSVSRRLSQMNGSLKSSFKNITLSSSNIVKNDRKISAEQTGNKGEGLSIQSINSNASDDIPILNLPNYNKRLR